jgi:hypothetical protein
MNYKPSFRLQLTAMIALLAFCMAVMAPVSASAQAVPTTKSTQSLTTLVQGSGPSAQFSGVLNISRFAVIGGVLNAVGTLSGTLTNTTSGVVQTVTQAVNIPLAGAQASCQILNLTLGPLSLNLLGLQVNLNQVVLNITAQPGPGNLLGNLLCDVANLLNGSGAGTLSGLLSQLSGLLNQIVGAL